MGGGSAEREISLRTGEAITKALEQKGYDVCPIDVGYDIPRRLLWEQYVRGRELTLGAVNTEPLPMIEIAPRRGFYGGDGVHPPVPERTGEKAKRSGLEVNTMPGMTETILVPKAAQFGGIDFPELVEGILRGASLKTEVRREERDG
jgi:hypothetical protein